MTQFVGICLEGTLEFWGQAFGYGPPQVCIDHKDLTCAIEAMIRDHGIKMESGALPAPGEGIAHGRWALTLVRYKD